MSSSAIPFAPNASAVESGFIAAGVTISTIAAVQALGIVLSWLFLGG